MMDIAFTEVENRFRGELAAWLGRELPDEWRLSSPFWQRATEEQQVRARAQWHTRLRDGGWVGLTWPTDAGGRGMGLVEQAIYAEEVAKAEAPEPLGFIGLDNIGPTIIQHGRDDQRLAFLPRILAGDDVWCQGFSEPNAGSDMASLTTRAVRDGDVFVVNGQKTWCSHAHVANRCMLLARTDPAASRHSGITALIVDMDTPGITVRPIGEITRHADFNEVFFDDVRVPAANVLGAVNAGWGVAMTTLGQARGVFGLKSYARYHKTLSHLWEIHSRANMAAGPGSIFRSRFADLYIGVELVRLNSLRTLSRRLAGEDPGYDVSLEKVHLSLLEQNLYRFAAQLDGPRFAEIPDDGGSGAGYPPRSTQFQYMWALAGTIYGGTTEIQKNIIAERILKLPREP